MSLQSGPPKLSYGVLEDVEKPHFPRHRRIDRPPSHSFPPRSSFSRALSCLTCGFAPYRPPHVDRSPHARRARLLFVLRASLGEVLSTFFLIFLTCSAGLVCELRAVDRGPAVLINALTAGLTVCFCIYALYRVSGCHMNPIISLSLLFTSHISIRRAALYVLAQFLGGQLAMLALYVTFRTDANVWQLVALKPVMIGSGGGSPMERPSAWLSVFCMEGIGAAILVLTNFKAAVEKVQEEVEEEEEAVETDEEETPLEHEVSEDQQERDAVVLSNPRRRAKASASTLHDLTASRLPVVPIALAMGATVAVLVLVSQASSGGGYNPIRYLCTAIWSGTWDGWWCWIGGELVGCVVGCGIQSLLEQMATRARYHRWKAMSARRRERERKQRRAGGAEERKEQSPA